MPRSHDLSAFQWRCGRCGHWNNIQDGVCRRCKSMQDSAVDAFRMKNVLTNEEKLFYDNTAPSILHELVKINATLRTVISEIREVRNERNRSNNKQKKPS